MVARIPIKQRKIEALLNPILLRETVNKVDKCMARLQEIQLTIGGTVVKGGVNLSPRSTRNYLSTSLRCKQEHLRIKNATPKKSTVDKYQGSNGAGEWSRMSLPAMLVNETLREIIQASQFVKQVVSSTNDSTDDPKTPATTQRKKHVPDFETTELNAKRKREKQSIRTESNNTPSLQRAKSRINFKISPLPKKPQVSQERENNSRYIANRVSPKHKPWARKTVLFPNPLFISTNPSSAPLHQRFCKTGSPVITKNRQTPFKMLIGSPPSVSKIQMKTKTPHKFLIKSPPPAISKSQMKMIKTPHKFLIKSPPSVSKTQMKTRTPHKFLIKSPPPAISKSQMKMIKTPHKFLIKSPPSVSKFQNKIKNNPPVLTSSSTKVKPVLIKKSPKMASYSKVYRSFSPSRIVNRLVSPLKSRKAVLRSDGIVPGLKQRPISTLEKFSVRRI